MPNSYGTKEKMHPQETLLQICTSATMETQWQPCIVVAYKDLKFLTGKPAANQAAISNAIQKKRNPLCDDTLYNDEHLHLRDDSIFGFRISGVGF